MEIRSPANPRVKRLKKLLADAPFRRDEGAWVVEGVRGCEEALASGLQIKECYVEEGVMPSRVGALVAKALVRGVEAVVVSRSVVREYSDTATPQGVCLVVAEPRWSAADFKGAGPLLVIDRLRDPGNLGTLFRTAAAAGARGIALTPETVDPGNPKCVRASAGAVFRLPYLRIGNASEVRALCPGPLYATSVSGGQSLYLADLSGAFGLVLGQEADGVGGGWKEAVDASLTIPMANEVESLNVAAAGAIILFEAARRRLPPG